MPRTMDSGIANEEVLRPDNTCPEPTSRLARQLALSYKIERMIDAGELRDYADAARRLGISRARVTQVVDLMLRPVWEQEEVLTD